MQRLLPALLLLSACAMRTTYLADGPLYMEPDPAYRELLYALGRAGVRIQQQDPTQRMVSGSYRHQDLATGGKPIQVLAQVVASDKAGGAAVILQATIAQKIDYGATKKVLETVETELRRHNPNLCLVYHLGH